MSRRGRPSGGGDAPADGGSQVAHPLDEARALQLIGELRSLLQPYVTSPTPVAPPSGAAPLPNGMTKFVTAKMIASAIGCSRSAAFRYLREAGGAHGRVALRDWESFAARRFRDDGVVVAGAATPERAGDRTVAAVAVSSPPEVPAARTSSVLRTPDTAPQPRVHGGNPLLPPPLPRRAIRSVFPRRRRGGGSTE